MANRHLKMVSKCDELLRLVGTQMFLDSFAIVWFQAPIVVVAQFNHPTVNMAGPFAVRQQFIGIGTQCAE